MRGFSQPAAQMETPSRTSSLNLIPKPDPDENIKLRPQDVYPGSKLAKKLGIKGTRKRGTCNVPAFLFMFAFVFHFDVAVGGNNFRTKSLNCFVLVGCCYTAAWDVEMRTVGC